MKTILVLTDFSKSAENAADIAVRLAGKLHADVLLFNVYMLIPIIPSTEAVEWALINTYGNSHEESNKALNKEAERLRKLIKHMDVEPGKPEINIVNEAGAVAECVHHLQKKREIEMRVMGSSKKPYNNFFLGSDTKEVLNKTTCPVLIIPEKQSALDIKNVVFATDNSDEDLRAITYLNTLSAQLKFRIHVSHVSDPLHEPVSVIKGNDEAVMIRNINKIHSKDISYTILTGDNMVKELETFIHAINADVLAMVRKKHSFFWRLFHQSHTKQFIEHPKMPLLIFPEEGDY